jgi:uncharacterized phage protein (TIGR02220 family)
MDYFKLTRHFWDFAFENPEKIKPNHCAMYLFIVEHCNRLGWKAKFGLPTTMVKDAIGIRSYNTYIETLNDLVEFGLIEMIEKSKNQYSSNIIAISNFNKALDKALDKATLKHVTKQGESTVQSIDSINKQYTNNNNTQPKVVINWDSLLLQFNNLTKRNFKLINDVTKKQILARLKEGYTKEDLWNAIQNCYNDDFHKENNHKYLTLEFISRAKMMEKYSVDVVKSKKIDKSEIGKL